MNKTFDQVCMEAAIEEARMAAERGDYAFGACIARNGKIIARGGNRVRTKNDSTKHVELEVIQYAVGAQHDRYLHGCTLYTTVEPCLMCYGAAHWAGVERVVYGLAQEDLDEFGKQNTNKNFRYRPSPIILTEKELALTVFKTEQLMKDECWASMLEVHTRVNKG
jgi:tRNA(adenine34) deaminase